MATRPYEGYPYSSPHVTDAPTIDQATASRWNNLPRRPIQHPREVVARNLPKNSIQISQQSQSDTKEPGPFIYIDVPDSSGSDVAGPASVEPETVHCCSQRNDAPNSSDKKEPDPFIYIDVPDSSGGDVAGPASPEPDPGYVQETIFYNPFENRRIDQPKSHEESDSSSGTGPRRPAPPPPRPTPPRTLDLHEAGSSSYPSTFSSTSLPSSSRETYNQDLFAPVPVSPFPDPPPAYSEIHTPQTPQTSQTSQTPNTPYTLQTPSPERTTQELPRTIVITRDLNQSPSGDQPLPIGLPSTDRKVVYCHHCGLRVHTLVIWECGPITHAIAFTLFCLMFIPLIVLLYWTNGCKYRNHYCPNCNKKIGYEYPALCIELTYTKN